MFFSKIFDAQKLSAPYFEVEIPIVIDRIFENRSQFSVNKTVNILQISFVVKEICNNLFNSFIL
jgi:hypothetical protein